jgi:hypothetical protein
LFQTAPPAVSAVATVAAPAPASAVDDDVVDDVCSGGTT